MRVPHALPVVTTILSALLLAACNGESAAPGTELTVLGSASAPPSAISARGFHQLSDPLTGDPASLSLGMYALYISANADCSAPELVQDYGVTRW